MISNKSVLKLVCAGLIFSIGDFSEASSQGSLGDAVSGVFGNLLKEGGAMALNKMSGAGKNQAQQGPVAGPMMAPPVGVPAPIMVPQMGVVPPQIQNLDAKMSDVQARLEKIEETQNKILTMVYQLYMVQLKAEKAKEEKRLKKEAQQRTEFEAPSGLPPMPNGVNVADGQQYQSEFQAPSGLPPMPNGVNVVDGQEYQSELQAPNGLPPIPAQFNASNSDEQANSTLAAEPVKPAKAKKPKAKTKKAKTKKTTTKAG